MRKLLVLAGVIVLPLAAWALSLNVSFRLPPLVNKIKPAAIVDETGNVLFGNAPGKVEVTNLPAAGSGAQVIPLAENVTLPVPPQYTCVDTDPVPVSTFRDFSLLGQADVGTAFIQWFFSTEPIHFRDFSPAVAVARPVSDGFMQLSAGGAFYAGGVSGSTFVPVLGPFLAMRVCNNNPQPMTVTVKMYARP